MAVLHPPESNFAKESVKWEAQFTPMGPGQRPYVFRPYPMTMHKAGRPSNGLGADTIVETVDVESELQENERFHEGFRPTPLEALDAFSAQQVEIAKLAAEINYEVKKKLSPNAAAEVERAQSEHSGHMATMPVTPIRKRGRPAKAKVPAEAGKE